MRESVPKYTRDGSAPCIEQPMIATETPTPATLTIGAHAGPCTCPAARHA